jgi:Arc/MetJ-type ribon-helix-helix transcriptional regulator
MDEMRNIALPEQLCRAAEERFSHRFGSLEEFLKAALNELLRDDTLRMDEREQQIVEERLKALGYV